VLPDAAQHTNTIGSNVVARHRATPHDTEIAVGANRALCNKKKQAAQKIVFVFAFLSGQNL
jgi:hypothetical protein